MNVSRFGYYAFLAIITIFVISLVFSFTSAGQNFKILAVLSGSMEPALHVGSVVVVNGASDYGVGDIITFGKISRSDIPITHRVQEIKIRNGEKFYITKGDANDAADSNPVAQSEIDGKVLFTVPLLGFVLNYLKTPTGFVLMIIIPAAAVIWEEGKKIRAELAKNKKKSENA